MDLLATQPYRLHPLCGFQFRKALARPEAEGVYDLSTRRDSGREESEEGGNGVTIEEGPPPPFEPHFVQKVTQSRSHQLLFQKQLQKM